MQFWPSRRRWLLAAGALVLFIVLDTHGAARAASVNLNVMSFNIRYANDAETLLGANGWNRFGGTQRKTLAIQSIVNYGPDLLGVQEPYALQINDLKAALPTYGFAGVGRNDGVAAGEYAGIFYRADRFSLADSGNFWLSNTPDTPGTTFPGAGSIRIASWVTLDDQLSGQRYFVLNTHWDNVSDSSRRLSAELIRDRLPLLALGLPVILMGDFNSTQGTTAYQEIRGLNAPGELQLYDSYRDIYPVTGSNERTYHDYQGGTAGSRIDFILHSSDFTTTAAAIDRTVYANGRWPSDHYPVTASFSVQAVPEPSSLLLAAMGCAGAWIIRRRRTR